MRRGIRWAIRTAAWRMLSVVVPNAISNGQSLPTIQVLMNGLLLEQFDSSGSVAGRIVHE